MLDYGLKLECNQEGMTVLEWQLYHSFVTRDDHRRENIEHLDTRRLLRTPPPPLDNAVNAFNWCSHQQALKSPENTTTGFLEGWKKQQQKKKMD